jgi:tRNA CCA-adding enzyme
MKNYSKILGEVLIKIKPTEEETKEINVLVKKFLDELKKKISKSKIKAEIFIGGSFAKKTLIKKEKYDIDIFIRFDKKYKDNEISKLLGKVLGKNSILIHGSRDYFRVKLKEDTYVELVPVKKINNPKEALNTTDLSYMHVKYINSKVKSEKMLDEIRLAKAFVHACECYGAESYIGGFSGYSLELLVYYYKGFLNFIKAVSKEKGKIIIDIEKVYKNKNTIMLDLNSAKLGSPIILIDPTYKHRNALAALTQETFRKFQIECKKFLENPKIDSFKKRTIDLEAAKKESLKNKNEFLIIKITTGKQDGSVAASKLKKFFEHLVKEISKFYEVKNSGFIYNNENWAKVFFSTKNKKEMIFEGPTVNDLKNVKKFKEKHKKTYVKGKKVFAKEEFSEKLKHFIMRWMVKNKERIDQMYINNLEFED